MVSAVSRSSSTDNAEVYIFYPGSDRCIIAVFEGIAVHDGWSSYFKFNCGHALCNAHHLRELEFASGQDGQKWSEDMADLLITIKETVDERKLASEGKPENSKLDPAEIKEFEENYNRIIEKGLLENPPSKPPPDSQEQNKKRGREKQTKTKNLLDRLHKYWKETLAFMYDFKVPFDNNQAERDIRMMKVQQKISGTFRSWEGAKIFCRNRGYISTVKKNSISVIDAIQGVFEGRPFIPGSIES